MKKTFWIGFVLGIAYLLVTYLFLKNDGWTVLMDILHFPAVFVVGGVLEYALGLIGLKSILLNELLRLSLIAIVDGLVFGLIFVIIRKLFK